MNAFIESIGSQVGVIGAPAKCVDCGRPVVHASTAEFLPVILEGGDVFRQIGFHLDGEPKVERVECVGVVHQCPNRR